MKKKEKTETKKTEKVTTKMTKKVDFKKIGEEAKKTGNAIKKFLTPYANLDRPVLSSRFGSFLKNNIDIIYTVGLVIFAVLFILNLGKLFCCFTSFLGGLIGLLLIFVIFRLLCEQISKK